MIFGWHLRLRRTFSVYSHLWVFLVGLSGGSLAAQDLPRFNVDLGQTSVSGLSSGAFMAVQFHTAYSSSVMGAGIIAGGPYNCAYVNPGGIISCMEDSPSGEASAGAARWFSWLGSIDPVQNLKRGRVYIFSGTEDSVVARDVVEATYAYYLSIGVPSSQVKYVRSVPAGHGFISPFASSQCAVNASPYINRCASEGMAYDQAGDILTHIYGNLNPPNSAQPGQLIRFSQKQFEDLWLGPTGFLYVPASCTAGERCRIHVAFHGCKQTVQDIGDQYLLDTGYNRWADSNNILVLYPQAPTDLSDNPEHCWDWWGYTGLGFGTRNAPQMLAVRHMVEQLAGAKQ